MKQGILSKIVRDNFGQMTFSDVLELSIFEPNLKVVVKFRSEPRQVFTCRQVLDLTWARIGDIREIFFSAEQCDEIQSLLGRIRKD